MEHAQTYVAHLDPTAGLWTYRLEGDYLVVIGRRPSEERGLWETADRAQPLYLRLACLAVSGETVALAADWRDRALAFADLYAPPVSTRRLALAREVPLRPFAEEALLLSWAIRLRAHLTAGKGRSRTGATAAALQIRALLPGLPEETFAVHPPEPPEEARDDRPLPASLPASEVAARLKDLQRRGGAQLLWAAAANVLASLLNLRLQGVAPVCLPSFTRSGLPQVGVGFRFPSPRARIWYGLWAEMSGLKTAACERCGRPFFTTRAGQRFCRKGCQVATGVERHRCAHRKEP